MTQSNTPDTSRSGSGSADPKPSSDPSQSAPMAPGDDAPPGTPGTGESICRDCGGTGRVGSEPCKTCQGSGKVNVGIGGA